MYLNNRQHINIQMQKAKHNKINLILYHFNRPYTLQQERVHKGGNEGALALQDSRRRTFA